MSSISSFFKRPDGEVPKGIAKFIYDFSPFFFTLVWGIYKYSTMFGYLKLVAGFLAVWIAFLQVRNWFKWRQLRKWGEQHGCGEAPTMKNKLPGGLERYGIFFKNLNDLDFLEDIIRKRTTDMGVQTYRIHGVFNRSIVTTSEPLNVQAILATQFTHFDLGPSRRDNFHAFMGDGIFTAEGEAWGHFRTQLKPQFTRDQVSDLESADHHLKILFQALPKEDAEGWVQEVDIMPMIYNFTMDVATQFLFGSSVNSQSTASLTKSVEQEKNQAFAEAMNYAQEYISWRIRLGAFFWVASSKRFNDACKTVRDFTDRFVVRALGQAKDSKAKEGEKEKFVLLDALVAETQDPKELRDQVLQTLLAGRDTTASLISWVLLLLSRDPNAYAKIREAVISQFGTASNPKQELTFSSLKTCKPITHILYETLRLYPLVPLNGRVALRDTTLPTGGGPNHDQPIVIKKGEQVGYSAYVMHRRKDIWGEDADVWKPERWEGRKLGWEWIAFSGGPRVCLGQQYALNEASFVLVKILQRFDKIEALDMGPIKKGLTITLSPRDGVKVKLHRAAE